MAGHIQDRWYKTEEDPDGKTRRIKTARYGKGMRYRARYIGPDGTEKSKSFPDGQKRRAEQWLSKIETDMASGQYIDPAVGRITFERFAVDVWMPTQTTDPATRESVEMRLRLHAFPHIGGRAMDAFKSSDLKLWMRCLEEAGLSAAYRRGIFAHVSTVFSAAVEERIIRENPCSARSVKPPQRDSRRMRPWSTDRVTAVREALPERYEATVDPAAGCGMRQGEVFGLALEDIDRSKGVVHIVRQVKLLRGGPIFAPPKGGKERDVPLPNAVDVGLTGHMARHKPVAVTLPWGSLSGPLVTAFLIFTSPGGLPLDRNRFNHRVWKPALRIAGVPAGRENGMHALRHFYASVLLDAGESIKAVSEYLGHHDPGFTLRIYTHLMPTSESRSRAAVDRVLGSASGSDGPDAAHRPD
ncbi:tyrosine-type recombinase/integrase [Streptomyces daliensis]|uniref:Site-specific integrase n=1 Tax=Streptomyces daliensis TaxID=299421 RepID=A0A8T4IZN4_9ACTN|nr:site-specific integrase [Streptomyces daliensis]